MTRLMIWLLGVWDWCLAIVYNSNVFMEKVCILHDLCVRWRLWNAPFERTLDVRVCWGFIVLQLLFYLLQINWQLKSLFWLCIKFKLVESKNGTCFVWYTDSILTFFALWHLFQMYFSSVILIKKKRINKRQLLLWQNVIWLFFNTFNCSF